MEKLHTVILHVNKLSGGTDAVGPWTSHFFSIGRIWESPGELKRHEQQTPTVRDSDLIGLVCSQSIWENCTFKSS